MLRLDPETVLILLTTTRIQGRFYRTGTVVGPCSVDDLRSCAVTSTVTTEPLFPVLDVIETEDHQIKFIMNSTNLGRRGEWGTQEGNGKQQTSQIRARDTGPQRGGQPAETAPAGQPSAGRGGGITKTLLPASIEVVPQGHPGAC